MTNYIAAHLTLAAAIGAQSTPVVEPQPLLAPMAIEVALPVMFAALANLSPAAPEFTEALAAYRADSFDAREWARIAKDAGAAELCLVVRGADGFAWFRTATTEFDVLSTGHERDLLRDLARACADEGVPLGISYPLAAHPSAAPPRAAANDPPLVEAQLRELTTGYGPLASVCLIGALDATRATQLAKIVPEGTARLLSGAPAAPGWRVSATEDSAGPGVAEVTLRWPAAPRAEHVAAAARAVFVARTRSSRLRLCVAAERSGSLTAGTVTGLSQLGGWLREHRVVLAAPPQRGLAAPTLGDGTTWYVLVPASGEITLGTGIAVRTARVHHGAEVAVRNEGPRQLVKVEVEAGATLPVVVELSLAARPVGR